MEENGSSDIAPWGPQDGPEFAISKVFDGADEGAILGAEVRNARLSGRLAEQSSAPQCNIVDSLLVDLEVDSVDFTRCDFKDTTIRNSRFRRARLGYSSFAEVTVQDSTFVNCEFPDTAMHDCEFSNVSFFDCDLFNVLIKTSNFEFCHFENCRTNNKVFETSRFRDCSFDNSELQVDTIEDNYGLISSKYVGKIRDGRLDGEFRRISASALSSQLKRQDTHPLKRLNIFYFLNEYLIYGSEYLDEALDVQSWSSRWFRSPGAYAVDLSQWVTFLLSLYETDQIPALPLVRLHSTAAQLAAWLSRGERHSQSVVLIYGAHEALSRMVQKFLESLESLNQTVKDRIVLVVEGGGDPEYYQRELAPLFERCNARIVSLTPHNSPWDLAIEFASKNHIFFLALLLATRVRLQIYRVNARSESGASSSDTLDRGGVEDSGKNQKRKLTTPPPRDTVFEISLPTGGPPPENPILSWNTLLSTNLALDLRLDVGTKVAGHIKQIVRDFLD